MAHPLSLVIPSGCSQFIRRSAAVLSVAMIALIAIAAQVRAQPQPVLFTEGPAGSGYFSFLADGEFAATGQVSEWALDAETGDLLTVRVEAENGASRPKLRLLNASGQEVGSVNGGTDGVALLQRHVFSSPGTYRVRAFTDHAVSPFQIRFDLGRSLDLEFEPNDSAATASSLISYPGAGEYTLRAGGLLPRNDMSDWYRIGGANAGNEIQVALSRDMGSLAAGEANIAVFRAGSEEALASVDGELLHYAIPETDSYFVRVSPRRVGGGALRFDGNDDIVFLPTETVNGATDLTVEFWFRTTKTGAQSIVSGANAGNDNEILLFFANSTRFEFHTGESSSSMVSWTIPSIADGRWRHFSIVRDQTAGEVRLAIDGVPQGARSTTLNDLQVAADAFLLGQDQDSVGGRFDPNQSVNGDLEELRIWRVARSDAEIAADFDQLLSGGESGLAGYWQFNEASGTAVVDLSPNGRDGVLGGGTEETRPLRVESAAPIDPVWGMDARYLVSVKMTDGVSPEVVGTTLPDEGAASSDIFYQFSVTYSEDMHGGSVTNAANYELRHAGPDNVFGTGDDHVHELSVGTYVDGPTVQLTIADGPLQPGELRLTINTAVTDRAGNPLNPAFVRNFTIETLGQLRFETIGNNSMATATPLDPLVEDPAGSGIRSIGGRGHVVSNSADDYDYWSFSGEEGDRIILASESVGNGGGTGLRYDLLRSDGGSVLSLTSNNGSGQASGVLPATGTYFVRVRHYYGYTGEYRFRVTLAPAPWIAESESNDNTGQADAMAVVLADGIHRASAFGHIHHGDAADFWSFLPIPLTDDVPLYPLPEGTVIRIQQSRPSSSPLEVNLELRNASGNLVASEETGAPSLTYTVPAGQGGRHYVRVSASPGTAGLASQYFLEAELEIPADVVPPEVVSTTLPTGVSTAEIDRFRVDFSEDLLAVPVNDMSNYDLRAAGADGLFDTADDEVYTLAAAPAYASGLNFSMRITDGPLQAGDYRFTVFSAVADRSGNTLEEDYVQFFTLETLGDYVMEQYPNSSFETATSLSSFPAGLFDGSFFAEGTISTGSDPRSIRAADFDGDGFDDLAVALFGPDAVRIFAGNGDGTFAEPVDYPVGSNPIALELADFNGDGELDLAVVNEGSNTLSILLGHGDGTFADAVSYPVGSNPGALAVGDLDGDGHLDVMVSNRSGASVSLFLGDGTGALIAGAAVTGVGTDLRGVALGDFDGDGKLDIAVAAEDNNAIYIRLGNGDGTFGESSAYTPAGRPNGVGVADLDGDGLDDIVAVHTSGTEVSVFRATGGGNFADAVAYSSIGGSSASFEVRFHDLDGDGRPDLVISGRNEVVVRYNRGEMVFESPVRYGANRSVRSAAIGDFNDDGRPDIAAVSATDSTITLLFGRGARILAADPAGTGVRTGAGRGNIADTGTEHYDYWSFSASAGERLLLGSESVGHNSSTGLRYAVLRPDGSELIAMTSNNGTEQLSTILPVTGTYGIQVRHYYNFSGEYRFRVTLAPGDWQAEGESNNNPGQANQPVFTRIDALQRAKVLGYIRHGDAGDVFHFRNTQPGTDVPLADMPVDTEIRIALQLPATSTLSPVIDLLRQDGTAVASATEGETELTFTVAEEGRYYARVRAGSSSSGVAAVYLLELEIDVPRDLEAPEIVSVSLPAEGTTSTALIDRFSANFSEDLKASFVNDPASYELRNAGADGIFETADDEVYTVTTTPSYGAGLSASYFISDGPLQPGDYRFRILDTVEDLAGNPLAEPFVRQFTMAPLGNFILERSGNNSFETGVSLGGPAAGFDGSFRQISSTTVGSSPYSVRTADFDGDGAADLVIAHQGANTVSILLGNGDGSFAARVDYPVGSNPWALEAGDFDEDGFPDVAVVNDGPNTISILLNQGDGTLAAPATYPVGSSPRALAVGDLNGDGVLDLVTANYNGHSVSVLLGNGDGTFAAGAGIDQPNSRPTGVALGDFDGDGVLDLAVANNALNTLSVYAGVGDGTFGAGTEYAVLANPDGVAAGDIDGDGFDDLVSISGSNSQFNLLRSNGDGTFEEPRSYTVGGSSSNREIVLADLRGDGFPDALIARGNNLSIRENRGGWLFDSPAVYGAGSTVRSVTTGDFDGDGLPDLAVVASGGNTLTIYLGREGHFVAEDPVGSGFRSVAGRGAVSSGDVADYDYWTFSANAQDRILLASENLTYSSGTGLRFALIGPDGSELGSITSSYGTEQLSRVLPVSGTYAIQVRHWYNYTGEYRFRILLAPSTWTVESESNDNIGQANTIPLTLNQGAQEGRMLGYLRAGDSGDVFSVGNVTPGTELRFRLSQTPESTFEGTVEVLDKDGNVRFSAPAGRPVIARQPISRAALVGGDVEFSVEAGGAEPLSYQWYRNGVAINGATSATYSLTDVQPEDAGTFHVVVENHVGSRTSASVTLNVLTSSDDAYFQMVQTLGPRGYWRFGESEGTAVADSATADGSQDGVLSGGATFLEEGAIAGDADTSIAFNGSDAYVRVADGANLANFTIAAWVKPTATSGRTIFSRTSGTNFHGNWSHVVHIDGAGKFAHYLYDGTGKTVTGTTTAQAETWYFVAVTAAQNGSMRLYVNGEQEGADVSIGIPWTGGNTYGIGHSTPVGGFFAGQIDEVALFPRALSAQEIADLYAAAGWTGGTTGGTITALSVDEADMDFAYVVESEGAHYIRLRPNSGTAGLMADYRLYVDVIDEVAPFITSNSLPEEGASTLALIDRFTLGFSEDMLAETVNDSANYELRGAGPDGLFDTEDDVLWEVVPLSSYSTGLTASLRVAGGNLQPDEYRFTAKTGLKDRAGNPLAAAHTRHFAIAQIPGFASEREPNDSRETATDLAMTSSQPGLISGAGRGFLLNTADVEYWAFEAEEGDILVLVSENPGNPGSSGMNFRIEREDGSILWTFQPASNGRGLSTPMVIPATGKYYLRVWPWYSYYNEHRFRLSLYRGIEVELEPNESIATATPLTLSPVEGGRAGAVGGFAWVSGDLDYFSLGTVQAGETIFLSVRLPQSSPMAPVVSLYNADNQYMSEAGSGRPFDGVAEIEITQTGEYFALVRSSGSTGGLMSEYILDALIVPSGGVSFPNLQVVNLSASGVENIKSGETFTIEYEVGNVGSQATQVGVWYDEAVLSANTIFGDEDDFALDLHQRSGVLAPGETYTVTRQVRIPDGIAGSFYVIVRTDSTNVVNEFVLEGDNETFTESPFTVELNDYPDLMVENLTLTGPDGDGVYHVSWETWNRGAAMVTGGFADRVQVRHLATNTVVFDERSEVTEDLAVDAFVPGAASFATALPGNYRVEVRTDADDAHFEYGPDGHAVAEQNLAVATFSITAFFTISLDAVPAEGGSVSGGGVYPEGATVTVTATPDTSVLPYRFVNWAENGAFRSGNASYTFTAIRDRELTAVFALPNYFIAVSANPAGGGTISGGGAHQHGSAVELTANPQPGYLFSHWSEGGTTISTEPVLAFAAVEARSLTAHFTEANPVHEVTTATEPAGIAAVSGAGTFSNGETTTLSAPATVVLDDTEYVFEKFTLNGTHFSGLRTVEKLFTTLDPAEMHFVAHYQARSLRPAVVAASGSKSGAVPAGLAYQISVRFDRTMDPAAVPVATLQSDSETPAPVFPGNGVWSRGAVNNDTFTTPPVTFGAGHDGTFLLHLAGAKDLDGREMEAGTVFEFTVDATPPEHPALTIAATTTSSATVSWSDYTAPADLSAFRIYRHSAPFTSIHEIPVFSGAGKAARSFTFSNLQPDTDYHVAVAAVDAAGNADSALESLLVRLESDLPPPVTISLTNVDLSGVRLSWPSYPKNGLVGFAGFRVFVSDAPFTSVAGMTPVAELGAAASMFEHLNLDRTREYHFAVVGFNRIGEFDPAVTSVRWSDPLAGAIAGDLEVGGDGETEIVVHESLVVTNGARLTVQPGTTLRFVDGAGLTVENGALIAEGTAIAPIHFTSANEEGGTAAPGDWTGIAIGPNAGDSILHHVWVRYGDGIQISDTNADLNALRLAWNTTGITFDGVSAQLVGDSLALLNQTGIDLSGNSSVTLIDSVVKSNGVNARAETGSTLTAQGNWWGTSLAPEIEAGLEGNVDAANPLVQEPVLAPAAAAAGGISQTGTRNLGVTLASPNAVAYRISEDSTFSGTFFQDVPVQDESDIYTAYPYDVTFELSPSGGLKTVFVQFQSVSGETSPAVSFPIEYVTDGPAIAEFNLSEGQLVTRPTEVTGSATAVLGVASIEFLVNGVPVLTASGGNLSGQWNPQGLSPGIYRVMLRATDNGGRVATREHNVTVQPTPPAAPRITSPADGFLTNADTVDVEGTAEASVSVRLTRNGVPMATAEVGADGRFAFADVELVEGSNEFSVIAFDDLGSGSSLPVTVERDTGPPASVILEEPVFSPSEGVSFTWRYQPDGKRAATFRLLWDEEPFSAAEEASGQAEAGFAMDYTVDGLPTGIYFFAVVGVDNAGNMSPISNLREVDYDTSPPAFTISYSHASPVGPGTLTISLTADEPLAATPMLTLRAQGASSPITVTLSQVSQLVYQGTFPVSPLSASSGVAEVRVSGRDLVGNEFVGTPAGPALVFDLTRPTGVVTIDRAVPVQVLADVTMEVGLALSKPVPAGMTPELSFRAPDGQNLAIALTGEGASWSGTLTLTPAMGSGFGEFFLETVDALGNEGTVIADGAEIEIYTTALPEPPPVPVGLRTTSLAGGEIRLEWDAASGAEEYAVFRREDGSLEAGELLAAGVTATEFVDLPPADGTYLYSITASRFSSESAASNEVPGVSDRTPPGKPLNLAASLGVTGIRVSWEAPAEEEVPAAYRVYRNGTVIRTVSSAGEINDSPPRGEITYAVAAVDAVGNENLSDSATLELHVGAVTSLRVTVEDGFAPLLQWNSPDPTAVGVNIYRNGAKRNTIPVVGTLYQDTLTIGTEPVSYAVRTVNASGQESAARALTVYPIELSARFNPGNDGADQPMRAVYFDRYEVSATNLAGAQGWPVHEIGLRRTSSEEPEVSIRKAINAFVLSGESAVETLVFPGVSHSAGARLFEIEALQQVDDGGSQAIYRRTVSYNAVTSPGLMMSVTTPSAPLAGGLNEFTVTVFNRGYADMDVVLIREGGAEPGDLSIAVLNPQGVEMSRTSFASLVPGLIFAPDGTGFWRLQPGESRTVTVPDVLIPEVLGEGGGAILQAELAKIYHAIGTAEERVSGPLVGMMSSGLTQTPYYGTSMSDKALYADDDTVILTGQALDRETGLPVPEVPLHIGFSTRGIHWFEETTTDASGNYAFEYRPTAGLGGSFQVWAAHPDVVDRLDQTAFQFYRVYSAPARGTIRMSKNDTLDFSIGLINPGDLPLTDFALEFSAFEVIDGEKVATEALTGSLVEAVPSLAAGGQRRTVKLRLQAELESPDHALVEFRLVSAEGASALFTGEVSLLAANPILAVPSPRVGYVQASLNRGEIFSREVTIENRGLRTLEDAVMILPAEYSWMTVNLPMEPDGTVLLPDLEVGETFTFSVVLTPPSSLDQGFYNDTITIRGGNTVSDFHLNIFTRITSSQTGSVQFLVDNVLVLPVPNATVLMRNALLGIEAGPFETDAEGEVVVPDLMEGDWSWRVTAAGHSGTTGIVRVSPDETTTVETRLDRSMVTVNFSVVPVPYTDRYEIKIEQTFQTRVPVPVLVMTPQNVTLSEVEPGFVGTVMFEVRNEGLISVFDAEIFGKRVESAELTPLITYIPEIRAQETILIPTRVEYFGTEEELAAGGGGGRLAMGEGGGSLGDAIDCYKNFKYGDVTLTLLARGESECPDGASYYPGASATINIDKLLDFACKGVSGKILKKIKVVKAVCIANTIIKGLACALAQLPEGQITGRPLPSGGGGGTVWGGGGSWPMTAAACVTGETLVTLADGSVRRIDELAVGDRLFSGSGIGNPVAEIRTRESAKVREIFYEPVFGGAGSSLKVTNDHRIWVDGTGWTAAVNVEAGDWLHGDDGRLWKVTRVAELPERETVYTLHMEDDGVFYAGGILLEHECGAPGTELFEAFVEMGIEP